MKTTYLILPLALLLLTGCQSSQNTSDTSATSSSVTIKSSTSETKVSEESVSSTTESSVTESSTPAEETDAPAQENAALFANYTPEQITAARVWFTRMNPEGLLSEGELQFSIHQSEAGNTIVPGPGSLTFPTATTTISASPLAAGSCTYAINNDNTITIYPVPSHFRDHRYLEEEFSRNASQEILDNAEHLTLGSFSDDVLLSFLTRLY